MKLPRGDTGDVPASRVERVVSVLDDWVARRELEPGDPLPPEGRLAEHLTVSRTVIREAVRLLAERGLIEVAHGKRHRVRPPSPEVTAGHLRRMMERGGISPQQLMELRWPLETATALVAADRRTDADLEALRQCLASPAETLDEQVDQDLRFHKLLARATGNHMFELTLEVFAQPLAESRLRSMSYGGYARSLAQHQEILDAVEAGEKVRAEALMKEHLNLAMEAWKHHTSDDATDDAE